MDAQAIWAVQKHAKSHSCCSSGWKPQNTEARYGTKHKCKGREFFGEECFLVITHSFHLYFCWFTCSTLTNITVETLWVRQHVSLKDRRQCTDTMIDLWYSTKSWCQKKKSPFQTSVAPSLEEKATKERPEELIHDWLTSSKTVWSRRRKKHKLLLGLKRKDWKHRFLLTYQVRCLYL